MPPPPTKREIPSFLLGLLTLALAPIVLALYSALLFASCALARHAWHWMFS